MNCLIFEYLMQCSDTFIKLTRVQNTTYAGIQQCFFFKLNVKGDAERLNLIKIYIICR